MFIDILSFVILLHILGELKTVPPLGHKVYKENNLFCELFLPKT